MRILYPATLLSLGLFLATAPASAQRADRWTVTPSFGWYFPAGGLGSVGQGEARAVARNESSPFGGVSAESPAIAGGLHLRAQVAYAPRTDLYVLRGAGGQSCGSNCTRLEYTHERLAGSSVGFIVADGLFRPNVSLPLRPYVGAGIGVRHYAFAQEQLDSTALEAFGRDVTQVVGHATVGADVRVSRAVVSLEGGDVAGRYRGAGTRHDLSISLGLRLPVR